GGAADGGVELVEGREYRGIRSRLGGLLDVVHIPQVSDHPEKADHGDDGEGHHESDLTVLLFAISAPEHNATPEKDFGLKACDQATRSFRTGYSRWHKPRDAGFP